MGGELIEHRVTLVPRTGDPRATLVPRVGDYRPSSARTYRRSATGDSATPPVLLIHGIGMSHRYFDKLARELSAHHDVIALDLPGFGGTARPAAPWDIADYADHIVRVLGRIDVGRVIMVGHSMGAQFVTEAAARHPELACGVVLIGPVVEARRRSVWWQMAALLLDTPLETPGTNAIVLADYSRSGPRWYLTEVPAMLRYPLENRVPDIAAPVLVIRGARDPVSRSQWCHHLASRARDGEVLEVPGQAHVVQRSAAAVVASAITAFATRVAARP